MSSYAADGISTPSAVVFWSALGSGNPFSLSLSVSTVSIAARSADTDEEDQDAGDLPFGVDEDALEQDDLDTDTVTDPDA